MVWNSRGCTATPTVAVTRRVVRGRGARRRVRSEVCSRRRGGGKSEKRKRASSASFADPRREFCVRERGKDRGRRAARTQVLLLELAGQVALHEGGLACVAGKRDASGVCQRGLGDPGVGGRVPEGTREAAGSAIAQILKKHGSLFFSAPAMGGRGGSRTGTAVTDEDQLERGRLSHLSFLRAGAGNVGGQVRRARSASRRRGEGPRSALKS